MTTAYYLLLDTSTLIISSMLIFSISRKGFNGRKGRPARLIVGIIQLSSSTRMSSTLLVNQISLLLVSETSCDSIYYRTYNTLCRVKVKFFGILLYQFFVCFIKIFG